MFRSIHPPLIMALRLEIRHFAASGRLGGGHTSETRSVILQSSRIHSLQVGSDLLRHRS